MHLSLSFWFVCTLKFEPFLLFSVGSFAPSLYWALPFMDLFLVCRLCFLVCLLRICFLFCLLWICFFLSFWAERVLRKTIDVLLYLKMFDSFDFFKTKEYCHLPPSTDLFLCGPKSMRKPIDDLFQKKRKGFILSIFYNKKCHLLPRNIWIDLKWFPPSFCFQRKLDLAFSSCGIEIREWAFRVNLNGVMIIVGRLGPLKYNGKELKRKIWKLKVLINF